MNMVRSGRPTFYTNDIRQRRNLKIQNSIYPVRFILFFFFLPKFPTSFSKKLSFLFIIIIIIIVRFIKIHAQVYPFKLKKKKKTLSCPGSTVLV